MRYDEIIARIDAVEPVAYSKSRNFIDGSVTYLSPYLSRGVISVPQVLDRVLAKGFKADQIEKFTQELLWREYWQQVWIAKGEAINTDLRHEQEDVRTSEMPVALLEAATGIQAIDTGIQTLFHTGYMHNHLRMYVSALTCNIAHCHWKQSAQWMYYHLLDADWASNALSWQWVAGTNSNKKYVANQENINKYCKHEQRGTFLDTDYESLPKLDIPMALQQTRSFAETTPLPEYEALKLDPSTATYIYNFYNLDPKWNKHEKVNRVLLIEPSIFEQYPISQKSMDFMLALAENIEGVQIFVGSFETLVTAHQLKTIYYKEHPLNKHYKGQEVSRDWVVRPQAYESSFFKFWKKYGKAAVQER